MGPTGTPGEKQHVFGRFHTVSERRAGTILSYTGITEYTCFTIFAAWGQIIEQTIKDSDTSLYMQRVNH